MSTVEDKSKKKPTEAEKQELERLRKQYYDCKQSGCADEEKFREEYQDLAVKLLIDLSGKLDVEPGPEPTPDEGYQKPGGWGSKDADPNNWKVVVMKDSPKDGPKKYKVVDGQGVNIATEFRSEQSAQAWLDKARKDKPPPPPPPPGGGGEGIDQFGIAKIHRDKPGGQTVTKFELREFERNYSSGKPSENSVEYTASMSSKEHNSDVECTFYTKINGFKTHEADTISDKLNGPEHKDGAGSWGIPDFMTDGSAKKTLECEVKHPNNEGINPKPLTVIGGSIVGKWFGHKAITYIKDGKRYIESWIHFPVDNIDTVKEEQNEWRQYVPTTDISKYYTKANGVLTCCRIDGTKKGDQPDFKYCSVREIEPPSG